MSIEGLAQLDGRTVEELHLADVALTEAVRLTLDDSTALYLRPYEAATRLPDGFADSTLFDLMVDASEGSDLQTEPAIGYPIEIGHAGWPLNDNDQRVEQDVLRPGEVIIFTSPVPNVATGLRSRRVAQIEVLSKVLVAA